MAQIINTSCQYCVFKIMRKTLLGQVQTGCTLNRIEKFRGLGVKLTLEQDKQHKGPFKHFVIHNRFCTTLRTKTWQKKQVLPAEEAVRKEIEIQYDAIVLRKGVSDENLKKTINSLICQTIKPKNIRVVVEHGPLVVYDMLYDIVPEGIGIFVDHVKLSEKVNRESMIDIAADKCESTYYAVFNAGYEVSPHFSKSLDEYINDHLEQICLIKPDKEGNGLVVQQRLHNLIMGHRAVGITDKNTSVELTDIVSKAECLATNKDTIREYGDICCQ